jgi:hypothetical protein
MTFDPQVLSNSITIGTAFAAAFVAALWLSLMFWTYRDIRQRSRDPLLRFLAVLVVGVLFLPGILIYYILRPAHTLEDEYQQTLEEEALLQTIEESQLCPGCNRQIQSDWIVCPNCLTRVKKKCQKCGKSIELSWNICPYCGAPAPETRLENSKMDGFSRPVEGED